MKLLFYLLGNNSGLFEIEGTFHHYNSLLEISLNRLIGLKLKSDLIVLTCLYIILPLGCYIHWFSTHLMIFLVTDHETLFPLNL